MDVEEWTDLSGDLHKLPARQLQMGGLEELLEAPRRSAGCTPVAGRRGAGREGRSRYLTVLVTLPCAEAGRSGVTVRAALWGPSRRVSR